jgi:hypothetical protein
MGYLESGSATKASLTRSLDHSLSFAMCPALPWDSPSEKAITRCGPLILDQNCEPRQILELSL